MKKIKGYRIRLRKREILRNLKFDSRSTNITVEHHQLIQEQLELCYELMEPSVVYDTFYKGSEQYTKVRTELCSSSEKLKELIKRPPAISLMAVTIGSEMDKIIEEVKVKDLGRAVILDSIGSEAVEQAANLTSKLLLQEAKKQECHLLDRFSPGYSDWPLSASRFILDILEADKIGLSINDSDILQPRKSITALQLWKTGKKK